MDCSMSNNLRFQKLPFFSIRYRHLGESGFGFRKLRIHYLEGVGDGARNDKVAVPLPVGRHDVPRRITSRTSCGSNLRKPACTGPSKRAPGYQPIIMGSVPPPYSRPALSSVHLAS